MAKEKKIVENGNKNTATIWWQFELFRIHSDLFIIIVDVRFQY